MAGTHRKPKPSPYTIAAGAVAYSLAVTFHKHIPTDLIASAPAMVAVAVNALEHAVEAVDPRVAPVVERYAVDAEQAIYAAVAAVQAGVKDAPHVEAVVAPTAEIKPVV